MSSILTNTSAMTALQTLKSINSNLEKTQGEISTGKSVASAQDNASTWAIAKVMESDMESFKTVQNGLSMAESTVNVAKAGAEQITETLKGIKNKLVEASNPSNDAAKIGADIEKMVEQIESVIASAQFNGVNLLNADPGSADFSFTSSLDRDASGAVTPATQTVESQGLTASLITDALDQIDATTLNSEIATDVIGGPAATTPLTNDFDIDTLIEASVDASAELGSAMNRITTQNEYLGKLSDAMKTGIGSLVDANMEEASSRLQALQTQQQLGIQALTIANSSSQNILSLFR